MARTIHTHGPTGLRYTYDHTARMAAGEIQRTELVDHPGRIDRRYWSHSNQKFAAFCGECQQARAFTEFSPAMAFLNVHVKKHTLAAGAGEARIISRYVGFHVETTPSGSRDWLRAHCTNGRCTWHGAYFMNLTDAEKQGARHFQSHLDRPTPANLTPNPTKENPVTTLDDLDRHIAVTEHRLAVLLEQKARIEARPSEPTEPLITFTIQFQDGGTRYQYAARRDDGLGLWWLTGREGGKGRSWEELLEFMAQDTRVQSGKPLRFRTHRIMDGTLVKGEY